MAANLFVSRMTGPEVEEALRRAMSAVQTINGIHPTRNGNVFVEGVQEEGADGSIISAVYTPYIEDGVLYWENNAGLPNPEPVALTDFQPDGNALLQRISVNGVKPDGDGNVQLTAADVGAQTVQERRILPVSGWAENTQTVSVPGVTASSGVIVAPDPGDDGNFSAYRVSGVRCVSQGEGTLTFRCESVPDMDLTVNVQHHEGIRSTFSFAGMKKISDMGLARQYYKPGDTVMTTYTDTNGNMYDMPWDVVHIGDAKLADGTIKKDAIYLQSHYATVEGVQWDKEEREAATEETAQEGMYYYVPSGEGFALLDIAAGAAIPYADHAAVYHSAIKDPTGNICRYGYNRETHAAMPQWLNSAADKGGWWTAKHAGDVAPDQHGSVRGFMAGLPADFVDCMEELTITQALNTISEPDKTIGQESYTAKIFLPRLEQMYITPQAAGIEGEAWDYYKELAGGAGLVGKFAQWQTYPILISYALENHSSARHVRLASAGRGSSCYNWYVSSSGYVQGVGGIGVAINASRCRPACVI